MSKLIGTIGSACVRLRHRYVAIQNDVPESWSIGGTLGYIGLGSLAGAKPAPVMPTEEEAKIQFSEQ